MLIFHLASNTCTAPIVQRILSIRPSHIENCEHILVTVDSERLSFSTYWFQVPEIVDRRRYEHAFKSVDDGEGLSQCMVILMEFNRYTFSLLLLSFSQEFSLIFEQIPDRDEIR